MRGQARCVVFCLPKDAHNFCLKFGEFDGQHCAAGMENQIAALGKHLDVVAQDFAHAALDAVAFMGFADHFAHSKPNARLGGVFIAGKRRLPGSKEPAHG
jgi:hypothetical protein